MKLLFLSLWFFVLLFFSKRKVFVLVRILLLILINISFLFKRLLSPWLSLLLVLVYIRGLLILYFYFCTLIKKFESSSFKYLFFFFFFLVNRQYYSVSLLDECKIQIYRFFKQGLLNFLVILLLFCLWVIGKIIKSSCLSFRPCL